MIRAGQEVTHNESGLAMLVLQTNGSLAYVEDEQGRRSWEEVTELRRAPVRRPFFPAGRYV